jgi:hypothetical protein
MTRFDSNVIAQFPLPVRKSLAALLLGSAMLLPAAGTCAENVVQTAGPVSYVSGGVSDESLDQLKSMSRDFNLKLVFALKSGEFMSDVKVAIVDAKGNRVLDTTSEGPWLLAKLPAGSYQVVATASGNSIKQQVRVDSGKLRTLNFRWSTE